jgi:hypothetical protein
MPPPVPARRGLGKVLAALIALAVIAAGVIVTTTLLRDGSPTPGEMDAPPQATDGSGPQPREGTSILEDDLATANIDWDTAQGPAFSIGFAQGSLRFLLQQPKQLALSLNHSGKLRAESDVGVEVDAAKVSGPDQNGFGVVCRASSGGDDYYALRIGSQGTWDIIQSMNGQATALASGSHAIRTGNADWRLRAECTGTKRVTLRLFVDGVLVGQAVDRNDPLSAGSAGIIAVADGVPLDLRFSNFRVERI